MYVKPKKELGQHFLIDLSIAQRIAELLRVESATGNSGYKKVLEIGPGTGVLTQFLLQDTRFDTYVIEIDRQSVDYLKIHFPALDGHILAADFLNIRPDLLPTKQPDNRETFAVIGNFPYNISTQILFKVLDMRDRVPEVVGMFQRRSGSTDCLRAG